MSRSIIPSLAGSGRSAIVVTACAVLTQCFGIVAQLQIAALYGAGAEVDAYLAGITLPQVLITVVNGSLTFVLMPVFVGHLNAGNTDKAWATLASVIGVTFLVLGAICGLGMLFSATTVAVMFPGFGVEAQRTAVEVSFLSWPTVVITVIGTLLASAYQAHSRFTWPAVVPMLVALGNVGAIAVLGRWFGILGVPAAALLTAVSQLILLSRILGAWQHPSLRSALNSTGAREILLLSWPLLMSGLLVRSTPIIDRYLASGLAEGAIAHLGYASRLCALIAGVLSTGIATVAYPSLVWNATRDDSSALGISIAQACRLIWLVVAPVAIVGQILVRPATEILLVRGDFTSADAAAVADLLRIYLFAMVGMTLGNVTARAFYALKKTSIPAWAGAAEAIAYAIYGPLLARAFGIEGIAWAFVFYYTASLVWQGLWIAFHIHLPASVFRSFATTAAASVIAGVAAAVTTSFVTSYPVQLALGLVVATGVFGLAMAGVGRAELDVAKAFFSARPPVAPQPVVPVESPT